MEIRPRRVEVPPVDQVHTLCFRLYHCLRMSSFLTRTHRLHRWAAAGSLNARESAANLLAVATTAHAFRNKGSAEYGVMVFEKQ